MRNGICHGIEKQKKRLGMSLSGILLCGISIALFKMANWGTDPFQTFCGGIEVLTELPFGILYTIINGVMMVGIFLLNRKYIGLATVLNMTIMGFVVEWTLKWLTKVFPPQNPVSQAGYLTVGVLLLCLSSSLYFTADIGVSTYDAIALILRDKKIGRFEACRIGCDFFCVLVGWLCGAPVGVGTVITAFCMGPVIELFNRRFSRPLLSGELYRKNSRI